MTAYERVLVTGVFDHFHDGHVYFLQQAQKLGKKLYVIVAHSQGVLARKGFVPDHNQQQRIRAVQDAVPAAVVYAGDADALAGTERFLNLIVPDVLVLGYDQEPLPSTLLNAHNLEIARIPAYKTDQFRSSIIRMQKQKKQSCNTAPDMEQCR